MNNAILVNGITPQELTEAILNGFKNQIEELKKSYQPKEPEEFLTRSETAKLLKISLVTVWQWSNDGLLKPYKFGNRTYFSRKEINKTMFNSNK